MLPNPRPANIPGLFQFPPSLEPRLAPYDNQQPQRPLPLFASSSRIPVGTPASSAMRHNQPTPYPHHHHHLDQHHNGTSCVCLYSTPSPFLIPRRAAFVDPPHTQTPDPRVPTANLSFAPSSSSSPPPTSYPDHAQQQYVQQHSNYAASSLHHAPQHQWAPHPPASASAMTHVYAHAHAHEDPGAGAVAVKCEEGLEDEAMWMGEDSPTYDARPQDMRYFQHDSDTLSPPLSGDYAYSPTQYADDPSEMLQSPVDAPMREIKQEDVQYVEQPYGELYADEGASHNWGNAPGFYPPQPPDYYPTATASEPSDSSSGMLVAYPHPYSPGMFVDSPMSPDGSFPVAMPDMYSVPSLHSVRPLPVGPTRSYTLEGAITPVSPKPRPASRSTVTLLAKRKSSSPPPMGSLIPPAQRSQTQIQSQAAESPTPGSASASSPQPQPSGSGSSPSAVRDSAALKRPRGRPRKNPATVSTDPADGQVIPTPPSVPVPVPIVNPAPAPPPTMDGPTAGQAMFKLDMAVANGEGGENGKEPEKKKPIMACLFCRERKIACGPPPPGGPMRCK
ncbi:hypothetical protein L226DRAFT_388475 [Lentinus tigrinus ALCF2SS1-7]|uniref:uncharacterized protein n=1 Tax=Lentinus tigrinus ALCF2SS1-7 TaxID=1328758 RepID=UPI001165ECA8|nr:hypothetical protein L226DRAFT_388475 [Lentinus tigrinus ALCF2SS1-7]